MARSVAVTFDYRCPFAYNGNLAAINAIREGSDVEFRFVPVLARPGARRGRRGAGVGARAGRVGQRRVVAALRHRGARRVHRQVLRRAPRALRRAPRAGLQLAGGGGPARRGRVGGARPRCGRGGGAERPPAEDARRPSTPTASSATACSACPPTSRATRPRSCASWNAGDVDDLERMLELLQWGGLNEFKRPRIPRLSRRQRVGLRWSTRSAITSSHSS